MLSVFLRLRRVSLATGAALLSGAAMPGAALAQAGSPTTLPAVTVDAPQQQRLSAARPARRPGTATRASRPPVAPSPQTA